MPAYLAAVLGENIRKKPNPNEDTCDILENGLATRFLKLACCLSDAKKVASTTPPSDDIRLCISSSSMAVFAIK